MPGTTRLRFGCWNDLTLTMLPYAFPAVRSRLPPSVPGTWQAGRAHDRSKIGWMSLEKEMVACGGFVQVAGGFFPPPPPPPPPPPLPAHAVRTASEAIQAAPGVRIVSRAWKLSCVRWSRALSPGLTRNQGRAPPTTGG